MVTFALGVLVSPNKPNCGLVAWCPTRRPSTIYLSTVPGLCAVQHTYGGNADDRVSPFAIRLAQARPTVIRGGAQVEKKGRLL